MGAYAQRCSGGFVAFVEVVVRIRQAEGRRAGHRLGEGWLFTADRLNARSTAAIRLLADRRHTLLSGLNSLRKQNSEIMFRVLEVILCHDAIPRRSGIARQLQIFFVYVRSRAANFDVRTGRVERAAVIVLRPPAASTRAFHFYPLALMVNGSPESTDFR